MVKTRSQSKSHGNKWMKALKKRNAGKAKFCIPRKNTSSYRNIYRMIRKM